MYFLQTSRLQIRHYTTADASFSHTLLNSPGWLENIGDRKVYDIPAAEIYIEERILPFYQQYGFGMYLVETKDDRKAVGSCGLVKRDIFDHPDIGFAFLPEAIGKGYGYEAANAVLEHAKHELHIKKLLAIALPANAPSVGLLHKLGFAEKERIILPGDTEELILFECALAQ